MPLSDKQVIEELKRYGGTHAHSDATREKWDEIDKFYRGENEIKLPEAVEGELGDAASLQRLKVHTNFCKTIVHSTVTMAMASGVKAVRQAEDGGGGELDDEEAAKVFAQTDIRRLIRYASRYGAAWLQIIEADREKRYRVHKPHVARRIMMDEDPEKERAVLVLQGFERQEGAEKKKYYVARFYEWDDERARVSRRDFVSEDGSDWKRRALPKNQSGPFRYMPWIYVPNREEDTIPEQSDVLDGLEVFKQYDALRVKFLKALEDESFRQIFLANVGDDVANRIKASGGLNVWNAKNRAGEHAPEMQSVSPADHRQFLDGLSDLVDTVATVTRTSPLELNERPVQDIPAQTLRVLYGPQIERVRETTEHVNPALSRAASLILKRPVRITLTPRLPISEDKEHQNKKGLLDSNAYSIRQLLMDSGFTRAQAEEIFEMRLDELRRINAVEVEKEEELIDAEGEKAVEIARARPAPRPAA